MPEEYLTVPEIAKTLRVSEVTVRTWIRQKRLRGAKFGRDYRVKREDYEIFVKEQFGDEKKEE
jgi:excisionase family DNA binding protein